MTTGGYEEDCGDLVFVWKLAQCFRRDTSSILARARLSTKVDLLLLPLLSCLRQLGPKQDKKKLEKELSSIIKREKKGKSTKKETKKKTTKKTKKARVQKEAEWMFVSSDGYYFAYLECVPEQGLVV
ncbi:hypothetical protein GBAR_LOCUS26039 [Geodia barretti]|uniref:Uncharacterized protein n=1 Tax=Geodia barretti TaxID=519541 RepID=A0AA35TGE4_GEOBA|nr:hypothetical protein GBAR_LOCUS26039 [Geodia barretti]